MDEISRGRAQIVLRITVIAGIVLALAAAGSSGPWSL